MKQRDTNVSSVSLSLDIQFGNEKNRKSFSLVFSVSFKSFGVTCAQSFCFANFSLLLCLGVLTP